MGWMVVLVVIVLIALPAARMLWFFRHGGQLDAGGSDGVQMLTRTRKNRRRGH